jgi:hypothetical protein
MDRVNRELDAVKMDSEMDLMASVRLALRMQKPDMRGVMGQLH